MRWHVGGEAGGGAASSGTELRWRCQVMPGRQVIRCVMPCRQVLRTTDLSESSRLDGRARGGGAVGRRGGVDGWTDWQG